MQSTRQYPPRARSRSWFRVYLRFALLCTLPVACLGLIVYFVSARVTTSLVEERHKASAALAASLVHEEFVHRVTVLHSFSRRPLLAAAVKNRNEEGVRRHLQQVVESHPRIERAFVTDNNGTLWSDFPKAPESQGQNFSGRDWYKGVTHTWQPYVSGVYRRHASPQLLLVSVATPVREEAHEPALGLLVYQVSLEQITLAVQGSDGAQTMIVDHTGTIAAHPGLDLQKQVYTEYAEVPPIVAARQDGKWIGEYTDPINGEVMYGGALPVSVGDHYWVVLTQQPITQARAASRRLAVGTMIAAALLMGAAMGVGGLIARTHTRSLLALEEARNDELEARIAGRKLATSNEDLGQRLQSTQAQLLHAQKMEAVGRLAGGVAHDFNNLLSVIIGYCDLALLRMPADSAQRAHIEEVRKAGQRASNLTRQLLAFSRKQVLQPRNVDVSAVIAEMNKLLRRLLGEDIELVTRLAPGLPPVFCDASQLEQVIVNLAVNARDAMPGGGTLTIESRLVHLDEAYVNEHPESKPGPHVMIAVTDTGTGMDAETRRQLFEPFFTTKEVGRGTGLGLSTVYGIVRQSNGTIWVYSEPGAGSTFKIYLPAASGPLSDATEGDPQDTSPRGTESILVVEDDEAVRRLVVVALEGAGYRVLSAADPKAALVLAEGHKDAIDLLLTDVVMPGMNGPALARELLAARPGLRVLYMSGYTDNAIVHHGVLEPGTNFLEKPLSSSALLRAVRHALAR